jgi:hypothetical protein
VHAFRKIAWHLGHLELAPVTLGPLYPWSPGNWVWVKTPIRGSLESQWEGPYQVILTTPSALKVAGLKPWIHHTHAKLAEDPGQEWKSQANLDQSLKLTLTRGSANEAQTDLLILLTAVIIINDSQTNPPDPAGVSHKLMWEVKLSEEQEGTILINCTICALSGLVLSPLGIA